TAPPQSRYASSVSDSAEPAAASGTTSCSLSARTAPGSPSSARSGSSSAACTGRGAPRQPITASMPAMASTALTCAADSVLVGGPITTGSVAYTAVIRSPRNAAAAWPLCNSPLTTITSLLPCTTASAARPCRAAMLCTDPTTDTPCSTGGVPTITVAGAL